MLTQSGSNQSTADPTMAAATPLALMDIPDQTIRPNQPYISRLPRVPITGPVQYELTEADGSPLPAWLYYDVKNHVLYGIPTATGQYDLRMSWTNSAGVTEWDDFNLNVSLNRAPVAIADVADEVVRPGSGVVARIHPKSFVDPDGDQLTYSAMLANGAPLPDWLHFDVGNLVIYGMRPASDTNTPQFDVVIKATDPEGLSATHTMTIYDGTIVGNIMLEDVPNVRVTSNRSLSWDLSQYLLDPTTPGGATYSLTALDGSAAPAWLNLSADGLLTGTPTNLNAGSYDLILNVDKGGRHFADIFTLTVEGINNRDPVLNSALPDSSIQSLQPFIYAVPANSFRDPDGDRLTYSATLANGAPLPDWLYFDAAKQTFYGVPPNTRFGDLDITVKAADQHGAFATDTFRLNDATPTLAAAAPVVRTQPTAQKGAVSDKINFALPGETFFDANRDPLTYSATLANGDKLPDWLRFDPATRAFSGYAPGAGTYQVKVTATDPENTKASVIVPIVVMDGYQIFNGTAGNDVLIGSTMPSRLLGGDGNDTLYGYFGNNELFGGNGNDRLIGLGANERLDGGAGNDIMQGGFGSDVYRFGRDYGVDTIQNNYWFGSDGVQKPLGMDPGLGTSIDDWLATQDRVVFSFGISKDQLWFAQQNDDLVVSILGTNDQLIVDGWFRSFDDGYTYRPNGQAVPRAELGRYADPEKVLDAYFRMDGFTLSNGETLLGSEVQTLVDAMAGFTPPASATALPSSVKSAIEDCWLDSHPLFTASP